MIELDWLLLSSLKELWPIRNEPRPVFSYDRSPGFGLFDIVFRFCFYCKFIFGKSKFEEFN